MNVVIEIDGREALPVRALPWMTSWKFGAQEVAEAFAGDLEWSIPVQARYLEDSAVRNYPGEYWENKHTLDMEDLEDSNLTRDEWRFAATLALPAGVFVWRDEWEAAYNASPDGPDVLNEVAENIEDKEEVEGRTLNLNPCIPDKKICGLVMEGFINESSAAAPAPAIKAAGGLPGAPVPVPQFNIEPVARTGRNKRAKTLAFEQEVSSLMTHFWNDREHGTIPTKGDLHSQVYNEMLRGHIRGHSGKLNVEMVRDAAKPWVMPLVLPAYVRPSQTGEKRHVFKSNK